jgi:fatty acyl-CoA reductase
LATIIATAFFSSTVISSLNDPVPGWIENFNGPVGIQLGGGKGVLRVVLGNPNIAMDYMPVDIAVKVMCIAAWEKGRSW